MYPQGQIDEQQQYSPTKDKENKKPSRQQGIMMRTHGAPLNYLRYKDMLVRLGLLSDMAYAQPESQERMLLYDLWKILRGEVTESIYVENLRLLLQVILRLIDAKRVVDVPKHVSNRPADMERNEVQSATVAKEESYIGNEMGFLNEKQQLCVRSSEVQKIQNHFHVYFLNRLQFYKRQLDHKKSMKE